MLFYNHLDILIVDRTIILKTLFLNKNIIKYEK